MSKNIMEILSAAWEVILTKFTLIYDWFITKIMGQNKLNDVKHRQEPDYVWYHT